MSKMNLGAVTAYADAVAQGFTGTREEFGEWLANAGANAAAVASDRAAVERMKSDTQTIKDTALSEVGTAKTAAVAAVEAAGTEQASAVETEGAEQVEAVAKASAEAQAAAEKAAEDARAEADAQIAALRQTGESERKSVEETAEAKKAEIEAAGAVLYSAVQTLTEAEQAQARGNIGAAGAIVESASGEVITLDDASDTALRGMTVYGKSTQDGEPTPDAPVPIVSVGDDGEIVLAVEGGENDGIQTLPIATPDGLCGIPVSSGGNYTDADGQQWVCDEVDFGRGVRAQRIKRLTLNGSETGVSFQERNNPYFRVDIGKAENVVPKYALCDKLPYGKVESTSTDNGVDVIRGSTGRAYVSFRWDMDNISDTDSARLWLSENTPTVYYILSTPIETTLTDEELAAYRTLHTNKLNTTIYADDNAGLSVDYAADTKTYIDKKFDALAAAIINNN